MARIKHLVDEIEELLSKKTLNQLQAKELLEETTKTLRNKDAIIRKLRNTLEWTNENCSTGCGIRAGKALEETI